MDLIKELGRYQRKSGATIETLAADLCLNWFTVYRWLKGKTKPSSMARQKIRQYLEVKGHEQNSNDN